MYNVKQAAEILRLTTRSIQLKCKKHKVSKIGNEFQITPEILELWKTGSDEKRNALQVISKTSQRNVTSSIRFIVGFLIVLILIITCLYYIDLKDQITDFKKIILTNDKEHKSEVKILTKKLEDAGKVINTIEKENIMLKNKDSLRIFKKW